KCKIGRERRDFASARWTIIPSEISAGLKSHFAAFAEEASPLFGRRLRVAAGHVQEGAPLVKARLDAKDLPGEGYRLHCRKDWVELAGRDEAGLFYGLQTLKQILLQTGAALPEIVIEDYPDFAHRGFMLDISRCKTPTMKTLYDYVDLLAYLKINHLQLYTEHTFAFSAHETVWSDAAPMTAQEIMALDAYCQDRYIELTPNQNSFGHFERWLVHPEYKHLAEAPEGFRHPLNNEWRGPSTLKPDRASLAFLDTLYAELLPNFSSGLFNVGCDETWELGTGRSSRVCKTKGAQSVYLGFLKRIERLVSKRGRRMMFWGDIILKEPKLIGELPKDIIALNWGYEADYDFAQTCRRFAESGIPFFVCPGTSSWNSLLGRTDNSLRNIASAARNGLKHGAVGCLITDWGDNGHHQYKPISYVGIAAGAANSWAHRANVGLDIVQSLNLHIFRDSTTQLGKALYELGNLYAQSPAPPKNRTIFNDMLFWDMKALPPSLTRMTPQSAQACTDELSRQEEVLGRAQARCCDAELVKAELCNAIAMTKHGLNRYRAHLDTEMDRRPLRRELLRIIGEHARLWLQRNRHGGLYESSSKLRALLAPLE
ncbi:MAG: family 20 glycosylhydrolase, partial [Chitinivibrionales bacterium]|nr:family 20 glycosylhydrolase [Chitinivibrionales bacterium]MBD3356436.1 family 20 glycosylhydrolase [Chitinivibrionales bacterium]